MKITPLSFVFATFMSAIAGASVAGNLCSFNTECFENETCQDTQFQLEFRVGTDGQNEFEIVTDAETVGVSVGGSGDVAYLAGLTTGGFHVLTLVRATGAARYTNHIGDGPLSVTYLGTCEIAK